MAGAEEINAGEGILLNLPKDICIIKMRSACSRTSTAFGNER